MRRALEDAVDRVVVADRRRDGLGPVDHDLRGVRARQFDVTSPAPLASARFNRLTRATSTRGQAPSW